MIFYMNNELMNIDGLRMDAYHHQKSLLLLIIYLNRNGFIGAENIVYL